MRGITKRFPGVVALDNMQLDLYPGEVHILIGENGAGKSTLVKILSGVYQKDEGSMKMDGQELVIDGVKDAQEKNIGIIHQELNLLTHRTVYQNIYLGREPITGKILKSVDYKKMIADTQDLLDKLGLDIDPCAMVSTLSIAQRQMVEVAKALSFNAKILIMDEPTSSLTIREIETLFRIVRELQNKGVAIIYISHRMEEITQIGQRVTVMRDGKFIGCEKVEDVSLDKIIEMMVGRKIEALYNKQPTTIGDEILRTKDLCGLRFKDVNINVRRGEVVCLAGLVGAGRTEIAKSIFGYDEITSGSVILRGVEYTKMKPAQSTKLGMGFLPEDRRHEGLILDMPVEENTILASLKELFPGFFFSSKVSVAAAEEFTKKMHLSPPNVKNMVKNLSGGNQQKVVLARWLCKKCDLFIFDEPTRGVDVGAKAEIYELLNELARNGAGILVISSDLPEVVGVSDRIYVIRDGKVAAELAGKDITQQNIGTFMISDGEVTK